jgi:hypothetical protein
MRLGGNTLRGSNPRSSALSGSLLGDVNLGGLLVLAYRGHCVSVTGPVRVWKRRSARSRGRRSAAAQCCRNGLLR